MHNPLRRRKQQAAQEQIVDHATHYYRVPSVAGLTYRRPNEGALYTRLTAEALRG